METGAQQSWRGGNRRGDDPGDRTTRRGRDSGGDRGGAAGRPISSFPGEATIPTESRGEAAALGDTAGKGSGGADGGKDGDRADLRGGLPGVELWIPSEEECDTSPGNDPQSGQPGLQLCRRCGHSKLLGFIFTMLLWLIK